jgi:hypothetical protein
LAGVLGEMAKTTDSNERNQSLSLAPIVKFPRLMTFQLVGTGAANLTNALCGTDHTSAQSSPVLLRKSEVEIEIRLMRRNQFNGEPRPSNIGLLGRIIG